MPKKKSVEQKISKYYDERIKPKMDDFDIDKSFLANLTRTSKVPTSLISEDPFPHCYLRITEVVVSLEENKVLVVESKDKNVIRSHGMGYLQSFFDEIFDELCLLISEFIRHFIKAHANRRSPRGVSNPQILSYLSKKWIHDITYGFLFVYYTMKNKKEIIEYLIVLNEGVIASYEKETEYIMIYPIKIDHKSKLSYNSINLKIPIPFPIPAPKSMCVKLAGKENSLTLIPIELHLLNKNSKSDFQTFLENYFENNVIEKAYGEKLLSKDGYYIFCKLKYSGFPSHQDDELINQIFKLIGHVIMSARPSMDRERKNLNWEELKGLAILDQVPYLVPSKPTIFYKDDNDYSFFVGTENKNFEIWQNADMIWQNLGLFSDALKRLQDKYDTKFTSNSEWIKFEASIMNSLVRIGVSAYQAIPNDSLAQIYAGLESLLLSPDDQTDLGDRLQSAILAVHNNSPITDEFDFEVTGQHISHFYSKRNRSAHANIRSLFHLNSEIITDQLISRIQELDFQDIYHIYSFLIILNYLDLLEKNIETFANFRASEREQYLNSLNDGE